MIKLQTFLLLTTYFVLIKTSDVSFTENVKVFTVATEYNDGYERYIRSAKYYGIDVETLGMGTEWEGGNMKGLGGGYKVNLLKEALKPFKDDDNTIIIFTDSYDVIFTSAVHEIVRKFHTLDAKIIFGAEHYCWPDETLKTKYPSTIAQGARFLNSGMFMGYASHIYGILETPIENDGDDQLYYTQSFLNEDIRKKHNIKLDHKSEIFQNLNGAIDDVKLDIDPRSGDGILQNINFMTVPSIIHGNGPSKIYLNAFANYLGGTYENKECKICIENRIELENKKLPIVSVAVFVERAMPFLEEFFDGIYAIDYPKDKINLFIHNNVPYHEDVVTKFIDKIEKEYKTIKIVTPADKIDERDARKLAVHQADVRKSDYLFVIDAEAHIDDDAVLKDLISYNRSFIAPILTRPTELWSNFWGAISDTGYYARSHDYLDIVKGNLRGMWNVPYVSSMYLVKKSVYPKMIFEHDKLDPDMALCENLREKGIFMNVINTEEYGHLINNDDFDTKLTSPDLYTLFTNKADWERRYIHPDYIELLSPNFTFNQPCPDVYWFPIVTEKFCTEFIAIMEAFGKWSDGSNQDSRLEGGYEAVPTRDIHMNQVGLDPLWLKFLYYYVRPLQELVFTGYYHNPPRSLMNFVVRYRPDEQPALRAHHDSSTYTINIALNKVGVDYEGGGCKFLRYNCSVTATKMGWMLMHPGRLTHFHEGLRTISGTRYIMISFVDP